MLIDHSFGPVPTKQMSREECLDLLRSSVEVIRLTHEISASKRLGTWQWYFRGYIQWHSLAVVIAELGHSTNRQFATNAWAVLDPILATWDDEYKSKNGEPAWDHVSSLIDKARQMRRRNFPDATDGPSATASMPVSQPLLPEQGQIAQMSGSNVNHGPNPSWHSETSFDYGSSTSDVQLLAGVDSSLPQETLRSSLDDPYNTACAPDMLGLEGHFGTFDALDEVDFSAFDAVFNDMGWQFSTPNTDPSVEMQP